MRIEPILYNSVAAAGRPSVPASPSSPYGAAIDTLSGNWNDGDVIGVLLSFQNVFEASELLLSAFTSSEAADDLVVVGACRVCDSV